MSVYCETLIARCPACSEVNPGHVRGLPEAGVYGWTCPLPDCENTEDPTRIDVIRPVVVDR